MGERSPATGWSGGRRGKLIAMAVRVLAALLLVAILLGPASWWWGRLVGSSSQPSQVATSAVSSKASEAPMPGRDLLTAGANPRPAAAPARPARAATTSATQGSIFFMGDSLTEGYFATTLQRSFPALVASRMGATWTGGGVPGGKLDGMGPVTFPPQASLVVVELGTEDFGGWAGATPVNTFDTEYRQLLGAARAQVPGARIVCLGVWNTQHVTNVIGVTIDQYDAAIKSDCVASGGSFIPLAPMFDAAGTRGPAGTATYHGASDNFHPNDSGHAMIAAAILRA